MELNSVYLSLDRYEQIQEAAMDLKEENKKLKKELESIFNITEEYTGTLTLRISPESQKYIDKAFEPYKDTHTQIENGYKNVYGWNYGIKKE